MLNQQQINESLQQPASKRVLNKQVFSIVAKKYDWVTKLLSFGCDAAWKKTLVQQLPAINSPHCLDLACGTGDISALLAKRYPQGQIMAVDITSAMLELAQQKHTAKNIVFIQADMLTPPVADNSIDIVTGGYALRNSPDLDQLLEAIWKKLKPGGVASFLDFSKSDHLKIQHWQMRLLILWTGFWGIVLHGNPAVYNYIPASLKLFPTQKALEEKIKNLGFVDYHCQYYHQGFVAQICFYKPTTEI
jgi:ubiquinone/menaquinone biosynthesis methyltransferase